MSWKILSKENAISIAQLWRDNGKSDIVIRVHLATKGLTDTEIDEVLAELAGEPIGTVSNEASQEAKEAHTLGQMAQEKLKPQDSPRAIVFQLWKEGKSKLYIRNHLADRGFSEEEIEKHVGGLGGSTSKSQFSSSNYGTSGRYKDKYGQTRYQNTSSNSDGSSQVAIGVVIMLIGCAITYFSYQAAANSPTGGTYYITYGPIIWGGWMVLKGLMNGD